MIHHKVAQNSPEWDELRLGKVTASSYGKFMANLGRAFGDPAKEYALQVALERIMGRKSGYSFQSSHMERGHEMEPMARHLYGEANFLTVQDGGFFDCGAWGYSPDGLVGDQGLIEIKSVVAKTHFANIERGAPDPAYKWQLIGGLEASGRDWIDFVSFCADFPESRQLVTFRVEAGDVAGEVQEIKDRRSQFLELVEKIVAKLS
jgi:hypothetical protein